VQGYCNRQPKGWCRQDDHGHQPGRLAGDGRSDGLARRFGSAVQSHQWHRVEGNSLNSANDLRRADEGRCAGPGRFRARHRRHRPPPDSRQPGPDGCRGGAGGFPWPREPAPAAAPAGARPLRLHLHRHPSVARLVDAQRIGGSWCGAHSTQLRVLRPRGAGRADGDDASRSGQSESRARARRSVVDHGRYPHSAWPAGGGGGAAALQGQGLHDHHPPQRPSWGGTLPAILYDVRSTGAAAYLALAREILANRSPRLPDTIL